MHASSETFSLTLFGCSIRIRCRDTQAATLLARNYGALRGKGEAPALVYTVGTQRHAGACELFITREGQQPLMASDPGEFLFLFEKDLTVELQKLRSDLYFVHAAALEYRSKAFMLVGPSGSGKSTATWALLHHGCCYLSDELAPVHLKTWEVHPYPHALCLKDEPPAAYPLPKTTLQTSYTLHIPAEELPNGVGTHPAPLMAIFFVRYHPEASAPAVRSISRAEAAAHLYANALNPLAHRGDGLDGAMELATRVAPLELLTAQLPATCALVEAALKGLAPT